MGYRPGAFLSENSVSGVLARSQALNEWPTCPGASSCRHSNSIHKRMKAPAEASRRFTETRWNAAAAPRAAKQIRAIVAAIDYVVTGPAYSTRSLRGITPPQQLQPCDAADYAMDSNVAQFWALPQFEEAQSRFAI
jgi:hypothetical protein